MQAADSTIELKQPRIVMHIDDSALMREMVRDYLEPAGYDVISIADPTQVVSALRSTNCHVVISDVEMPELDGITLLQRIKHDDGGIYVIMLTGVVGLTTILQSMRSGADACLFKPLDDPAELLSVLEDTFRKRDRWWKSLADARRRRLNDSGKQSKGS